MGVLSIYNLSGLTMSRLALFLVFFVAVHGQYEGDGCLKDGMNGVCRDISRCQSAIEDIRNRRNPQICSFSGTSSIVCCLDVQSKPTTQQPPVATTQGRPSSTSTEYVPPVYDYVDTNGAGAGGVCEPVTANLTSPKTGQKAWDKCIEYQEQVVYPCEKGVALTGTISRTYKCPHSAKDLIVGGVNADRTEFPHMALLGFGSDPNALQWLCGGTLISDRFVMTAGHCTYSRDAFDVTYMLFGILKRTEKFDRSRLHRIKRIIKHPGYKSPVQYNDLALLESETTIKLDKFVVPACLDVGAPAKYERALATGWGATQNRGSNADTLQKVILHQFGTEECAKLFPPRRNMKNGFDSNTQICYGDKQMSKDTCQGDSGGPLQIYNRQISCMYTVIGVTSFGRACGFVGEPGIYTRVAAYVPWIESVVWP